MDFFHPSEYQERQNVDAPTTAPSTGEESLLVDNYDFAHRPPSMESTDFSTANSPFGSDKPGGHWNAQPSVPVQFAGVPLALRVRPPPPSPPQDDSQYGMGRFMQSMPTDGSFPPPQPYKDTINDGDVFGYTGEPYDGNQAPNAAFVSSMPPLTCDSRTNVPQILQTEQQLSTSYSSPLNMLERSSSGNKRKRVGENQWQPVDSVNNSLYVPANPMLLTGRPLSLAGELMLSIWQQTHQRMPMEGELVALSVVTGAAERAITYWLSSHRPSPFHIPTALPIPLSSGSSSNNVPTTPTPTAGSRKNTCNVKKRNPQPWDKAWKKERPYSCLSRCGWTFTKKGDWIKHEKINFPEHTFHCPVPNCRSHFGRKDKCRDHIRKVHKIKQTEEFDLDSRRTSIMNRLNDRCGFCGHNCTSWQEWYDHVGAHFENRGEGGPWTMSMWRYPWTDDAETGHGDEGHDDGNDPDNSDNDDSEKDAEHETDDSFGGYGARDPSHGSKRGGGDNGGRQSGSSGDRPRFQHMGAKYCTRSSQPPAPSALSEAFKAACRTNSMPQLNQKQPRRRTKKSKRQDQLKMNHPITWPLTEEQAVPTVAPGSSLRTERINPLVDLAVAGKSARDAHIAELAPYLKDKAQVISQPSLQAPRQTANLSDVNVSSHMDATSEDFDELKRRKCQDLLDGTPLVFCEEQSVGKKSVLEAITGIRFPMEAVQCRRFATEVSLKLEGDYSLLQSIDPAAGKNSLYRVPKAKARVPVQRCSTCDKEFKRPCDLTKHEKTHSRLWKCQDEECKYHTLGWPTEKDRDRHVNDKHSEVPALYECLYPSGAYQLTCGDNFRQYVGKSHNPNYVRSQNNGWNGKKLVENDPQRTPRHLFRAVRPCNIHSIVVKSPRLKAKTTHSAETAPTSPGSGAQTWKIMAACQLQTPAALPYRDKFGKAALDVGWLKQMGTEPGALEVIENAAHALSQLPSNAKGLLYVLAYLDPRKLSGYLMESASLSNWPQCVTDTSNHGVSEMLLRLINESLDRYARGIARARKDHIIEIDSGIDNVKSKTPITELRETANSLVNDRSLPGRCHTSLNYIYRYVLNLTHQYPKNEECRLSLSVSDAKRRHIFGNTPLQIASNWGTTFPMFQSLIFAGADISAVNYAGQALIIWDVETESKITEFAGHLATNEPLAGDLVADKKEPLLAGNSLEQEHPTATDSPMGRLLDVLQARSNQIGSTGIHDTLTSMANLAETYRNQGRWTEVEELDAPAIETRMRVLGEEHPEPDVEAKERDEKIK